MKSRGCMENRAALFVLYAASILSKKVFSFSQYSEFPKCYAFTLFSNKEESQLPPLPPLDDGDSYGVNEKPSITKRSEDYIAPWDQMDDVVREKPTSSLDSNVVDQISKQRQEIQDLMLLVQQQAKAVSEIKYQNNKSAEPELFNTKNIPSSKRTLKAMLFIDGTWLYYSLHRRGDACPIVANYGLGWQHSYNIDWSELPKLVAQEVQHQIASKGWHSSDSSTQNSNYKPLAQESLVEITRATCFTSYKASTDQNSLRVKMFNQMEAAGFDMVTMETVGRVSICNNFLCLNCFS